MTAFPALVLMSCTVWSRPISQPQVSQPSLTNASSTPWEVFISDVKRRSRHYPLLTSVPWSAWNDISLPYSWTRPFFKIGKQAILFHRNHFRMDDLYLNVCGTKLFQACCRGMSQKIQRAYKAALRYLPKMSVIFCLTAFNLGGKPLCMQQSLS